ncbi:MAG: diacylglycerol/lipid kinase family protein [Desulfitobacterium sp.]
MNKSSWFAIVNPASANSQTRKIWPKVYKRLLDQKIDLDYAYTAGPGEATTLTRQALHNYTRILSVGGDGTLNEVVNGFFENKQPINPEASLAIFSHGTGADFLRSLNQKRGLPSLLEILHREQITPVDCGLAQYQDASGMLHHRYFLNVANLHYRPAFRFPRTRWRTSRIYTSSLFLDPSRNSTLDLADTDGTLGIGVSSLFCVPDTFSI